MSWRPDWSAAAEFYAPRVGDLVQLRESSDEPRRGMVVNTECATGWIDILLDSNKAIKWPAIQLELIAPDELSDDQLESVRGGMSQGTFGVWRAEIING